MAVRTFDPQPIFMNVLPDAFEWAVDQRIPEDGVTCFLGEPGAGKTYAAVDAVCCMATGLDCWGQKVGPPRTAIYIAADAGRSISLRIITWITAHREALAAAGVKLVTDAEGRESLPGLLVWPRAVNFHSLTEAGKAIDEIKAHGLSADILCIDTLFHSTEGANLTKPEDVLPILSRMGEFMNALRTKTCVLVHHTTKSGEDFYGTVAFKASVAAMILFKKTAVDTTKTVSCMRIRDGETFKEFDIKMLQFVVRTKRDKFGRTETVVLSVVPGVGVPLAKAEAGKAAKQDNDMELMQTVFNIMGNRATRVQWMTQMRTFTTTTNRAGEVVKEGWSEDTFDRKLKMFKELHPDLGGGRFRDDPYYLGEGMAVPNVMSVTRKPATPQTLRGFAGDGLPADTRNHPQNGNVAGDGIGTPGGLEQEALAIMLETATKKLEKKSATVVDLQEQRDR
jgi:hypothetical protein